MQVLASSEVNRENAEGGRLQVAPSVCAWQRGSGSGECSERRPIDSESLQSSNKAVLLAGEGTWPCPDGQGP